MIMAIQKSEVPAREELRPCIEVHVRSGQEARECIAWRCVVTFCEVAVLGESRQLPAGVLLLGFVSRHLIFDSEM